MAFGYLHLNKPPLRSLTAHEVSFIKKRDFDKHVRGFAFQERYSNYREKGFVHKYCDSDYQDRGLDYREEEFYFHYGRSNYQEGDDFYHPDSYRD